MRNNVSSFGADISSFAHNDDENKNILILGEGPTQRLHDTTLTAKAKYLINFTQARKRFVLTVHYDGSNSFLLANGRKRCQLKRPKRLLNKRLCTVFIEL